MNHFHFAAFRAVNNSLAFRLALMLLKMTAVGLVVGYLGRYLFFWAPKNVRRDIGATFGGLGVLGGLRRAVDMFLR